MLPSTCHFDAAACTWQCDGWSYDLSPLKPKSKLLQPGADKHAQDSGGHDYYWRTCDEKNYQQTCKSKVPEERRAAIQTWSNGQGCAVLGDLDTSVCRSAQGVQPGQGLQCQYKGGDGAREVTFKWLCATTAKAPAVTNAAGSPKSVVTISHPSACATHAKPPSPKPSPPVPPGPQPHFSSPPPPAVPPQPPSAPAPLVRCDHTPSLTDHATACRYSCGGRDFDLGSLLDWSGGSVTADDGKGGIFHWGVCGQTLPKAHQCSASGAGTDAPAATRISGGKCTTVGRWTNQGFLTQCNLIDPTNASTGLRCLFESGDGGASLSVDYMCTASSQLPTVSTVPGGGGSHYRATMFDPQACGVDPSLLLPLSIGGGSAVVALALVLCLVLCRRRCRRPQTDEARRRAPADAKPAAGSAGAPATLRSPLLEEEGADGPNPCPSYGLAGTEHAGSSSGALAYSHVDAVAAAAAAYTEDAELLAAGLAAAARVAGLEALMSAAELPERLAAAGTWCEEEGWHSVAHLRGGGARAADAFVAAMHLKSDGARSRRLKRELRKDEFAWDAHATAARAGQ